MEKRINARTFPDSKQVYNDWVEILMLRSITSATEYDEIALRFEIDANTWTGPTLIRALKVPQQILALPHSSRRRPSALSRETEKS